jgi:hypothetical protein
MANPEAANLCLTATAVQQGVAQHCSLSMPKLQGKMNSALIPIVTNWALTFV